METEEEIQIMPFKTIGGLWQKNGTKGKYYSGRITINEDELIKFFVFTNKKEKDNQPDYRIMVPYEPVEESKPKAKAKSKSEPKETTTRLYTNEEGEQVIDEVPF